jgi:hypothetical protein
MPPKLCRFFLIHGFSPVVIVFEAPQASFVSNRKLMTFLFLHIPDPILTVG